MLNRDILLDQLNNYINPMFKIERRKSMKFIEGRYFHNKTVKILRKA